MRLIVDDQPIEFQAGESLLVAMLRAGLHPTGGGCLCLGGDCPHCLVTVDGVSYVRACQTPARAGIVVERHHQGGACPPLLHVDDADLRTDHGEVATRHLHCDVVVIGQGEAGREAAGNAREAGKEVVTLDVDDGQEAVGIYPGPLVVARTPEGTLQVHVRERIVVATGAAEIQPVAPGTHLEGLVTRRAATTLSEAGLDLGRVFAVGEPPEGVECQTVEGEVVRFEGDDRVEAVVVRDAEGDEHRHECDTVALGLGLHPRDTLLRMGHGLANHNPMERLKGEGSTLSSTPGLKGEGSPLSSTPEGSPLLSVTGDAALDSTIPPCPRDGVVCPCSGTEVSDLEWVWERGFHELELVKRATLAGTGTCQGSACLPHIRSFLQDKGKELQPPFTARPVTRQLTLGEIASGAYHHPTPRTPLHEEHVRLGAQMERSGGWWRPWSYGDTVEEQIAVREAVSIGDVSTLGKFVISGPDALAFLERLYPTKVSTLKVGRSRYALLFDERGYVLDDGLICRDSETRYTLTLTSAGSTFGELWLRDWIDALGYDVRLTNETMTLGAINVTGPQSVALLASVGAKELPGFARHLRTEIAGVDCRVYRLSFTGELSYELHHHAADSVVLWRRLLEAGKPFGIKPHGLEALLNLRLEKGHIVVGQDTDYDSTARRIHHEWAVKMDKGDFVGRQAIERTNRVELDRQLVGLEMESPAPVEGEVVWSGDRWVGNVTSSTDSPTLGKSVLLAWLYFQDGELPEAVTIDGRPARRVPLPFYDPDAERARAKVAIASSCIAPYEPTDQSWTPRPSRFQRLEATRVQASPAALAAADWPADVTALPIAGDEALVLGTVDSGVIDDSHAIVERETGFSGAWIPAHEATELLARTCAWELPDARPSFAQGAVADVPTKLYFEEDRVLFVTQTPWAHELEDRLW